MGSWHRGVAQRSHPLVGALAPASTVRWVARVCGATVAAGFAPHHDMWRAQGRAGRGGKVGWSSRARTPASTTGALAWRRVHVEFRTTLAPLSLSHPGVPLPPALPPALARKRGGCGWCRRSPSAWRSMWYATTRRILCQSTWARQPAAPLAATAGSRFPVDMSLKWGGSRRPRHGWFNALWAGNLHGCTVRAVAAARAPWSVEPLL